MVRTRLSAGRSHQLRPASGAYLKLWFAAPCVAVALALAVLSRRLDVLLAMSVAAVFVMAGFALRRSICLELSPDGIHLRNHWPRPAFIAWHQVASARLDISKGRNQAITLEYQPRPGSSGEKNRRIAFTRFEWGNGIDLVETSLDMARPGLLRRVQT